MQYIEYEEYVYTEEGEEDRRLRPISAAGKFIPKAEKIKDKTAVFQDVGLIKPSLIKISEKAEDFEEYFGEDEKRSEIGFTPRRKFVAVSRNIALIESMKKKKSTPEFEAEDRHEEFDKDDYFFEEPIYETAQKPLAEDFGELTETVIPRDTAAEYSEVKRSAFTPPDILEEHARQLKGQIIVFVKKRLHVFEIELQHIEGSLMTMKKKIDFFEKSLKELGERLMFMDANFSQRAGDLSALKEMAETHQVSIVTIMHHLDKKAEAYAVNQKVSRKELTVIEDRILKLCVKASSEMAKLEEKIDDSLESFTLELDKKLYTEEFEVRLELVLHKMKILATKIKDAATETPVLDFEGTRPVEIKKFVLCKDGTRKQVRNRNATWNSASESKIPDREVSPKTALQVQKELELASIRESKRYVEGAYTKFKVGRK